MEPIITKLIVKRFRSFPNEVATFGNPTFLVGRNGAGKSNFADLFSFVGEAMSSPLQAVFDRRGGISAVRNRSSGRSYPPNMGVGIYLGAINGQIRSAHFSFEIKALPNYGFDIVREQCAVTHVDGACYWYDRRGVEFRTNVQGLAPLLEPTALSLPVIGGDRSFRCSRIWHEDSADCRRSRRGGGRAGIAATVVGAGRRHGRPNHYLATIRLL